MPRRNACTLPAETEQGLLNRWNTAADAAVTAIDFNWPDCDLLRQASDIAHANPVYDAETRSLMRERITELELPA